MANEPGGIETSTSYTLTGPSGATAVINDATSVYWAGTLAGEDAITGLDGTEIREAFEPRTQADGAIHGSFFRGRRPITLHGEIVTSTVAARNAAMTRLQEACDALREDGELIWTPAGSTERFVLYRQQQPIRFSGAGWKKDFFVSLVCNDPRIYSTTITNNASLARATDHTITNNGSSETPPVIRVTGPGTDVTVDCNGQTIVWDGTLIAGEWVEFDVLNKTALDDSGASVYSGIDFVNTVWWNLQPGDNTVRVDWTSGSTAASVLDVTFRDAWL